MCCMLHNIGVGLRLAEAALTESAVTVWPVHRCANVSPAYTTTVINNILLKFNQNYITLTNAGYAGVW